MSATFRDPLELETPRSKIEILSGTVGHADLPDLERVEAEGETRVHRKRERTEVVKRRAQVVGASYYQAAQKGLRGAVLPGPIMASCAQADTLVRQSATSRSLLGGESMVAIRAVLLLDPNARCKGNIRSR